MRNFSLAQLSIFDYLPNDDFGDLYRYTACIKNIDFSPLVKAINLERGNGRNNYPAEVMLNILTASLIFKLISTADIRRELNRNPTLRRLVGLNDFDAQLCGKTRIVPSAEVFSHFMDNMIKHQKELNEVFYDLRYRCSVVIPDYGKELAGDGKYFDSYCPNKHEHACNYEGDRRSETDANYSIKEYSYTDSTGQKKTKKETHYGFRKHTLVDCATELPVASLLTVANEDERRNFIRLLDALPSYILFRTEMITLDRGYDSKQITDEIRRRHIIPIIDERIMRKGDKLQQYMDTDIYYIEAGEVFMWVCQIEGERINESTGYPEYFVRMKYAGYDQDRDAIRYEHNSHIYRLLIKNDPKVFNMVARDSKKFTRLYNKRTSVERYHGRLDQTLGFENHTIRGIGKMTVMVTLADIIMLAMALVHVQNAQVDYASLLDFHN